MIYEGLFMFPKTISKLDACLNDVEGARLQTLFEHEQSILRILYL